MLSKFNIQAEKFEVDQILSWSRGGIRVAALVPTINKELNFFSEKVVGVNSKVRLSNAK